MFNTSNTSQGADLTKTVLTEIAKEKMDAMIEAHYHLFVPKRNDSEGLRFQLENTRIVEEPLGYANYLPESHFEKCYFEQNWFFEQGCFKGATFVDCFFKDLQFTGSDFRGVRFYRCTFDNVYVGGAVGTNARFMDCLFLTPFGINEETVGFVNVIPEGDLIVWKKLEDGYLCKLLIPAHAQRSMSTTLKCRASEALVLEILQPAMDALPYTDYVSVDKGWSMHCDRFAYEVGKTVRPKYDFEDNRWEECASGIHFFLTRELAESY